jgi:hypothetical protein
MISNWEYFVVLMVTNLTEDALTEVRLLQESVGVVCITRARVLKSCVHLSRQTKIVESNLTT